ncbi:MAG: hypothetical protein DCF23_00615 [Cyanobium sp.]|nr:MAG: hypothetical protein DCF23_00615 [Cyanobium sp.]
MPLQPLAPSWQLRLAAALVNSAAFPLVGLALLQLAGALSPDDNLLKRRQRICSRLAVAAALGFLLLLPLQTVAGLRQSRAVTTNQASRIKGAEVKLAALRQAVATAGSGAELKQKLQSLEGPVLGPAELSQPLPRLRAQLEAVLDQAEQQIAQQRPQAAAPSPWLLLPDLLRNGLACLALAIGFAAMAQRPGQSIPLLKEVQDRWQQWTEHRRVRRLKASQKQQKRPKRLPSRR